MFSSFLTVMPLSFCSGLDMNENESMVVYIYLEFTTGEGISGHSPRCEVGR